MKEIIINLLKGIPNERVELLKNYERQEFEMSLLKTELETKKSLGKIPEVLYGDAQKKIKEARTVLDNFKKALDGAGNNREFLEVILKEKLPQVKEATNQIKKSVERYLGVLEGIEKHKELFASRKQYLKSLRDNSTSLIEQLRSQINGIERNIKENEKRMREFPPVPKDLIPWLTRLEALEDVLKDFKEQIYQEQNALTNCEVGIIYAEAAENRLKTMSDRLKREGESYLFSLEEGAEMNELISLSIKISTRDREILDKMKVFVKTFGPKTEDSIKITRDRVERSVDEHLAMMGSKWKENGWSEEKISKETEREKEKLWKEWESYLK